MRDFKLTQEQDNLMRKFLKTFHGVEVSDLVRAMTEGYEVEHEINVGDIVKHVNSGFVGVVYERKGSSINIRSYKEDGTIINRVAWSISSVEKIEGKEYNRWKELIFWSDSGRDVWELKRCDLIENSNGHMFEVDMKNNAIFLWSIRNGGAQTYNIEYIKNNFKVVCFAEDRKDI